MEYERAGAQTPELGKGLKFGRDKIAARAQARDVKSALEDALRFLELIQQMPKLTGTLRPRIQEPSG